MIEKLDELYYTLRAMVKDNVAITFVDKEGYRNTANVVLQFSNGQKSWTHFHGKNLVDAFKRAIDKLSHPEQDYVDLDGNLWKANEHSVFEEKYIRMFLNESSFGKEISKEAVASG